MKLVWKYARRIWPYIIGAVLCLIVESMVELWQPALMANIVDIGVANHDTGYIYRMAALMIGIVALSAFAAAGRNIISARGSQYFGSRLRRDLFAKIQKLSLSSLDTFGAGTLMTRITNDVGQMQGFMQMLMRIFAKAIILSVGGIIMTVSMNPRLALIPIAAVPVVAGLIVINLKIGFPMYARVQQALDRVNTVMREYLSGVRVVKAFNRFEYEKKRFAVPNDDLKNRSVRVMRVMSVLSPAVSLVIYGGITAILWVGGGMVNEGGVKTGQIIAFVSYMTQILHALTMMANIIQSFVRAGASDSRLYEIMCVTDLEHSPDIASALNFKHGIEFNDVTFTYRTASGRPALSGVSFHCDIGERVGVIGATGSGKSTLVSLVLQFYAPDSGEVRIFGTDLMNADPREVRRSLAVVPQQVMLFTGTIHENLLWGRDDATDEEIEAAARSACAHDFILDAPDGYDTMLGHRGVNLSGGQRQRIAIARALIKKPHILILDDCLSAVDALTEAEIRKNLAESAADTAVLIVSQKISSIIDCDRILVLDDGAAVGVGTHDELLESCSVYRDIYLSQYGKEALIHA